MITSGTIVGAQGPGRSSVNGVLVGAETAINFIAGTNISIVGTDNVANKRIDITISATGGGGVTTLAAVGSAPNANGATITGTTLNLQPFDATHPGVMTNGAQTITGLKTIQTVSGHGVLEDALFIYNPGALVNGGGLTTGSSIVFKFNNPIGSAQPNIAYITGYTYDRNGSDGPDGAIAFKLWYENGGIYTTPVTVSIHGLAMNPTQWGGYIDIAPTGFNDSLLTFFGALDPISTTNIQFGIGSGYVPDGNNGSPIYVIGDHFSMAIAMDQGDGSFRWYQSPGNSGGTGVATVNQTMMLDNGGNLNILGGFSAGGDITTSTNISASGFFGSGNGLTNIDPSGINAGGFSGTFSGDGLSLTLSASNIVGGTVPFANGGVSLSSGDLTGRTAAVTSVVALTTPNDATNHTYLVSAYITVTAVTLDVIQVQVTYTDETNTARTQTFSTIGATPAVSISATGFYSFSSFIIRTKPNTAITIKTVLTTGTGSITYDVGGVIERKN